MTDTPDIPAAAVDELRRGRQVAAIKLIREANGIGLKEAKDLADAWTAAHPDEVRPNPAERSEGGALRLVVVLVLLGAAWWAWSTFGGTGG